MTATPSAPADVTLCPIDATGARVCTQLPAGVAAPTSSTTPGWVNPTACVNTDPTTGACLDSSILQAQQLGIVPATTPAPVSTTIAGIDLSTIPGWVWYVLFGGGVYWLFFKKRGR
jgi:hypothetical protein